jgi:hypothetical protein
MSEGNFFLLLQETEEYFNKLANRLAEISADAVLNAARLRIV